MEKRKEIPAGNKSAAGDWLSSAAGNTLDVTGARRLRERRNGQAGLVFCGPGALSKDKAGSAERAKG